MCPLGAGIADENGFRWEPKSTGQRQDLTHSLRMLPAHTNEAFHVHKKGSWSVTHEPPVAGGLRAAGQWPVGPAARTTGTVRNLARL